MSNSLTRLARIERGIIQPAHESLSIMTGDIWMMATPQAANLMLITGQIESGFEHRTQIGGGSAVSWWQMEIPTVLDMLERTGLDLSWLLGEHWLARKDWVTVQNRLRYNLIENQLFACQIARLVYWHKTSEPIPANPADQLLYYKKWWNNHEGASTKEQWDEARAAVKKGSIV